MKVSSQLKLAGWVGVGAVVLAAAVLQSATQQVERELVRSEAAAEVLRGVADLNFLTLEYVQQQQQQRGRAQWQLRHASLSTLLARKSQLTGADDRQVVDDLRRTHSRLEGLFSQLVANGEIRLFERNKVAVLEELEARLTGQIVQGSMNMISDARRLSAQAGQRTLDAQRRAGRTMMVFAGVVLFMIAAVAYLVVVRIERPLESLRGGVAQVRADNLEFRLGNDSRDEIGELARGFDDMMEKLKYWRGELVQTNEALSAEIGVRRQTEQVLRMQTQRAEALLEAAPDPVVIADEKGRIVVVNARAEAVFGYPRAELLGQCVELLIPQRLRATHVAHVAKEVASRAMTQARAMGEGRNLLARRRDGSEFAVDVSLNQLETPEGMLFISTVKDVSERVRAEQRIADYMARMRALSGRIVAVQEEERRALARELHDEIGQGLTAVKIRLQAMEQGGAELPSFADNLRQARITVAQILEQVRSISLDLRPMPLDDLGLAVALRSLVARTAETAGWAAHVDENLSGERLVADLELACYRVAQEALTNVMRHADAANVWITLRRSEQALFLAVRDDGRGFDPKSARPALESPRLGLLGMEERVRNAGGGLEIVTRRGQGTEVRASFPLGAAVTAPSSVLA
ncbi:MAG: PAS domain S-box protein [Rubrivivax sp.]|nr:PAS domain S-box protein [Rubrivivax sp.]